MPNAFGAALADPRWAEFDPAYVWACDRPRCDGKPHEGHDAPHARWNQIPPATTEAGDSWLTFLMLCGRGAGKTRTGSEFVKALAGYGTIPNLPTPKGPTRGAIIVPSYASGRDVCLEGDSGVLSVLPPEIRNHRKLRYNRSIGELILPNGSRMRIFTGEEPDTLRGHQHHWAWIDELASLRFPVETWDQMMFGLRLGKDPRVIVTTTPKPVPILIGTRQRPELGIMNQSTTAMVRFSTHENLHNLAPSLQSQILDRYEGTRLGAQELYAEILADVEGAIFDSDNIEKYRVSTRSDIGDEMTRIVVAVDPSVTSGPDSDEAGIVVVGKGRDGDAYVLDDRSLQAAPPVWASAVVRAYDDWAADRVVAETNNGGDIVVYTLRVADDGIPVTKVNASRGKQLRAEPVADLYARGRVHHVGMFGDLEQQMTTWVQGDRESPDRLDALVYGITELMIESPTITTRPYFDRRGHGRR